MDSLLCCLFDQADKRSRDGTAFSIPDVIKEPAEALALLDVRIDRGRRVVAFEQAVDCSRTTKGSSSSNSAKLHCRERESMHNARVATLTW